VLLSVDIFLSKQTLLIFNVFKQEAVEPRLQ